MTLPYALLAPTSRSSVQTQLAAGIPVRAGPRQRSQSCPAAYSLPYAVNGQHNCGRRGTEVDEPPYAPYAPHNEATRGFWHWIGTLKARMFRYIFTHLYPLMKRPLGNVQDFHDVNELLTLFVFLGINMLPVHIFSLVILLDYVWLSDWMEVETRLAWLDTLYCATMGFTVVYALNAMRLLITLLTNWGQNTWLDFEALVYDRAVPAFWTRLKWAVETMWRSYHWLTWKNIRAVQTRQNETEQAVREVCIAKNMPADIADCIVSMLCVEGVQELDYRWYLHDNRKNLKQVRQLDYETRECIASFLIPKQAFDLDKDRLVDLYCETDFSLDDVD